jgi:hypothetical protein
MRSLLLPLPLLMLSVPAHAALRAVPGDYASVQAAVDAAASGDVIGIARGTYVENVVIVGKDLTLVGDPANPAATVIRALATIDDNGTPEPADDVLVPGNAVEVKAASSRPSEQPVPTHVVLSGLTVLQGDNGLLIRPNTTVEFLDGYVFANDDGISLEGRKEADRGIARAIVKRSVFVSNTDDGVDCDRKTELWIEDSVIRDSYDDGIEIRLQNDDDFAGAGVTHVFLRNRFERNGRDGLQLISYDTANETARSFRVERSLFLENGYAGIGMMCNAVSLESFEGCPIPERVVLLHNSFVGNDHGLSGGADLIGVNNLFAGQTNLGAKNVASPSLLAYTVFHDNGTDHVGSNVEASSTLLADPLLAPELTLGEGSPAVDAGAAHFVHGGETLLDVGPCEFSGAAPDLGAFERDTGPPLIESSHALDVALAAGFDDALEKKGKPKTNAKRLDLGSTRGDSVAGLRFAGVAIPAGARIDTAHLQLMASKKSKKPAALEIRGEAVGDAAPFSTQPRDLSARPKTAAAVAWPVPAWPTKNAAGADQRTPDLAAVLQEIVDDPDWEAGHALALFVGGIGKRSVAAFEGGVGRPSLHVDFTTSAPACVP